MVCDNYVVVVYISIVTCNSSQPCKFQKSRTIGMLYSLVVFRFLTIMATVGARLLLEGEGLVTGTGDFVNVLISNSGNGHASEKRFARGITVADLKVY